MLDEDMVHKSLHIAIDARPVAFSAAEHAAIAALALLGVGSPRLLLSVRLREEDPPVPDPDGRDMHVGVDGHVLPFSLAAKRVALEETVLALPY